MSGIEAAIVELEAHCSQVSGLISALRRMSTAVEAAHQPTIDVTVAPKALPTHAAPRRRLPARTEAPQGTTRGGVHGAAVLAALRRENGTSTRARLVAITKLTANQVGYALTRLQKLGLITGAGQTNTRRFSLPGSGAGTRAGSARGSGPGQRPSAAAFETVWDGAKERAGSCPSLLGARDQKA